MDIHSCYLTDDILALRNLLDAGANPDEIVDGFAPLHYASANGRLEMVEELLRHHADVDLKDENGYTALDHASCNGELEIVRELIKYHATIDLKCNSGNTALYLATRFGYVDIVRELLEYGDDPNESDSNIKPLHLASKSKHPEMVQQLIYHGANVHARTESGRTPLHLASAFGRLEIVKILIPYCDLSLTDAHGKTAVDLAKTEEIKAFLIDYQTIQIKEPEFD